MSTAAAAAMGIMLFLSAGSVGRRNKKEKLLPKSTAVEQQLQTALMAPSSFSFNHSKTSLGSERGTRIATATKVSLLGHHED
mmetsp:Transcript_18059/g.36247  ORF Transcript_18059/g.36247 Transcript_18059/m.36247 type:complete len:82 (-) Transcript_18059:291-536(-)